MLGFILASFTLRNFKLECLGFIGNSCHNEQNWQIPEIDHTFQSWGVRTPISVIGYSVTFVHLFSCDIITIYILNIRPIGRIPIQRLKASEGRMWAP